MENEFINRYKAFCKSLNNLAKSKAADPKADFVLEGTALNFNFTFDISWKVMKDILIKKMGILDFAVGSPRETLQQAFTNGLITDDQWLQIIHFSKNLKSTLLNTTALKKQNPWFNPGILFTAKGTGIVKSRSHILS